MSAAGLLRKGILPLILGRSYPPLPAINVTSIIQSTLARFPGALSCCQLRFLEGGGELDITDGYFDCSFPHTRHFAEDDAFLDYAEQTIAPTVACHLCDQLNLRSQIRQLEWLRCEVANDHRTVTVLAGSHPALDVFFTEAAAGQRPRVDCKIDWRVGTSTVLVMSGSKPLLGVRIIEARDAIRIAGGIYIPSMSTVRRTTCDPRQAELWQIP